MFWFSVHSLSQTFLILRRNERDIFKMYVGLHVQCPLFLPDVNDTWNFSTDFRKLQKSNFMKIHPVAAELSHADGQTDRHDEANCRFSQFSEQA